MPWTTVAKNAMLNAHTSLYASLFDGDPADTGIEVSAARVAATYAAAANGARALSNNPQLTVAGGDQATHWALFDAATAGNMLAYGALSSTKTDPADFTVTGISGSLDLNNDPA
ncbi:phage tail fiber protein [Desulfovibrio caledoniensis]